MAKRKTKELRERIKRIESAMDRAGVMAMLRFPANVGDMPMADLAVFGLIAYASASFYGVFESIDRLDEAIAACEQHAGGVREMRGTQ